MKSWKRWVLLCGFAAVLGLTGCQTWTGHRSDERTSGQVIDDKRITSEVKGALANEPVFKFNDVDVKTFEGVVQLSGFVNTEEQKQRAGAVAQQTPGVARVVNNITLKPSQGPTPTGRINQPSPSAPIVTPPQEAGASSNTNTPPGNTTR